MGPADAQRSCEKRSLRSLLALVILASGLLAASAVLHVGLDWSDTLQHKDTATGLRCLVIAAAAAIMIAMLASLSAIIVWERARAPSTTNNPAGTGDTHFHERSAPL